ncbi:glycosyltransferase family 9 protein [Ferrovibrio sp.]|uniref:glycosyltransferase family 9 protein n=1 Tax=Ferrovibrio sp. TaxID=1917215 RepID=UPI003D0D804B
MQGYLLPDQDQVAAARARLDAHKAALGLSGRPAIGLSWRSANAAFGAHKSLSLGALAPLLRQPGLVFVSVQYGDTAAERAEVETETGIPVWQDPAVDPLRDMDAAAAQLGCLDLVITVSNTAVHLAGALGVPTWLLLPAPGHGLLWYWQLERTDTPYYSTVTCFRQAAPGDWAGVVGQVAGQLDAFVTAR